MTHSDLLVPRPLDEPTLLPLTGDLDLDLDLDVEAADRAKIFAAPESPDDWPRWRERLAEWRHAAWQRWPHDGAAYHRQAARWTQSCFTVALVWLWDERLFDHTTQRFTLPSSSKRRPASAVSTRLCCGRRTRSSASTSGRSSTSTGMCPESPN